MQKIIFFDIDRTLYNYQAFLKSFTSQIMQKYNLKEEELEILKTIYEDNKTKYGYFAPNKFIGPIIEHFPFMDKKFLNAIFWDEKMFTENLYKDSKELFNIAKVAKIGVFSEGDEKFQKEKIEKFRQVIDDENLYVFIKKLDLLPKLINKYKNYKIYLVDDHLAVLLRAKEIDKNVFTIMINRSKTGIKSDTIDATIENLYQVLPLIR